MPDGRLSGHSYGKDGIRILTRGRTNDTVFVRDLTLDVRLSGDFGAAFVAGDNSTTLPTDSLRNHAYAVADELPSAEPEAYAAAWLARLLAAVPAATRAWASVAIHPWAAPVDASGREEVVVPAPWSGRAEISLDRGGAPVTTGGISHLSLMAPFGSGFSGFLRDEMTDQTESSDRVMAGGCRATWHYGVAEADARTEFSKVRDRVRIAMTAAFGLPSSGAQGTVYAMAQAALAAAPELSQITVEFAGRPHSPVALSPSGAAWAVAAGPTGVSEATVGRS